MTMHRANAYIPPIEGNHTRPRVGAIGAAAALDLLECDPASLLAKPIGGRRDKSAAKLARERYEEALESKDSIDLLEFNSPKASSSTAVGFPVTTANALPGDAPGDLWPGETVLARYNSSSSFYRARVVRVYSSRGISLVDVEWLRPQVADTENREYLNVSNKDPDESLHSNGLQVRTDVRRPTSGDGIALLPQGGANASAALRPAASAASTAGVAYPDLLDLQAASTQANSAAPDLLGDAPLLMPLAGGPAVDAAALATTGLSMGASTGGGPVLTTWTAPAVGTRHPNDISLTVTSSVPAMPSAPLNAMPAPANPSATERFGFVSDMISKAVDAPVNTGV